MLKSIFIWNFLRILLEDFSSKIIKNNLGLKCSLGFSENEFFLLRAYCSLTCEPDGNEVAITIDIKNGNDDCKIESDIVGPDNGVLASHFFLLSNIKDDLKSEKEVTAWLAAFSDFLSDKFDIVNDAVATLK